MGDPQETPGALARFGTWLYDHTIVYAKRFFKWVCDVVLKIYILLIVLLIVGIILIFVGGGLSAATGGGFLPVGGPMAVVGMWMCIICAALLVYAILCALVEYFS
jgi:hypothetical protein